MLTIVQCESYYDIYNYAGLPPPSGSGIGDGGPANRSTLNQPSSVAISSSGTIYISDSDNNRIRVVYANGTIQTFAGNGQQGYSGDGSLAIEAQLNIPNGIALSSGIGSSLVLYIADTMNFVVRVVNVNNGIIDTFAGNGSKSYGGDGGPATSASIGLPFGVAVSSNTGLVYITDYLYCVVRVVYTNGTIDTFAGNGQIGSGGDGGPATSASFSSPWGIAVSSNEEVYIADSFNNVIRCVINGTIHTFAGNSILGYSGDGGLATDAQLNNPTGVAVSSTGLVYIADQRNQRIRIVNSSTGIINTFAGDGSADYNGDSIPATSAGLYDPTGVAISSVTGEIYIADTGNNRIREVLINNIIATVAGGGGQGYSGDNVPAIDSELNYPNSIALSSSNGNLYIADTNNNRIRIVYNNGTIDTLAGNGISGYSGDGGVATSAKLDGPTGVAVSSNNEVYISDTNNCLIRKVLLNGTIISFAGTLNAYSYGGDGGPATNASLNLPLGIVLSSSDSLYIADSLNNRIRVVYSNGTMNTFAGNGIGGFSGDGGLAIKAEIGLPKDVAVASNGDVYIADYNNNRVRVVYNKNGTIATVAGNGIAMYSGDNGPAFQAGLNGPSAVSVSTSGEVFIADTNNNRIRMVLTNGDIVTVAGDGTQGYLGNGISATSAMLNSPLGVAISLNNNIWISDSGNNVIRFIDVPSCFGIGAYSLSVCSSDGTCSFTDSRSCDNGFTGYNCQMFTCNGVNQTESNVCSGNGTCVGPNTCKCTADYTGSNCQFLNFALKLVINYFVVVAMLVLLIA
jgi:DNA-binding beta-propeller fold protein YncE